jgi:hypothetical protein
MIDADFGNYGPYQFDSQSFMGGDVLAIMAG